jgi:hypothetical protein
MATENAYLLVSLPFSTVTREQYVERSKERARSLLMVGRIHQAVASMMMDMRKYPNYPNCEVPHEIQRDRHLCRRGWRCRLGARLHRGFCLKAVRQAHYFRFWPKADMSLCAARVRFRG